MKLRDVVLLRCQSPINATLFEITRPFHPGSYQGIGPSTSLRASFQPSMLTYATVGRNCYQGIRLLCSCAVPARDLTFRYLVARLNRLRKKSRKPAALW